MSLDEIFKSGGITLIVVMTLIQIAPVKINPWSWLGKLTKKGLVILGKAMNGEVLTKITGLEAEISNVKDEVSNVKDEVSTVQEQVEAMSRASAEQATINARARILRFGDELLHGQPLHSKDHFDSILKDCKAYENYCKTDDDFENGITEPTIERIRAVYKERLEKNDFM